MKFLKADLRDKIYGAWVGKNIGGTIGAPYEGTRDTLDVQGFSSRKGEPLPNDDLDLQLAWLRCMDELGPEHVNARTLGEYWLSCVKPHWNEYADPSDSDRRIATTQIRWFCCAFSMRYGRNHLVLFCI